MGKDTSGSTPNKRPRGNNNSNSKSDPKNNAKSDDAPGKMKNPCQYHNGTHPWADCFGNKNSKNFNEGFKLLEKGKWQPKPRRDNAGDAHRINQSDASKTTVSDEDSRGTPTNPTGSTKSSDAQ
jgi:hypothetical protein